MNENARQFGQGDYLAIKTASRSLVKAVGGLEMAEGYSRIGKTHIARCYDPQNDQFLPVDVVADLEAAAGVNPVTEALARLHGCRIVNDKGGIDVFADLSRNILDITGHLGQASAQLRDMDEDGHRTNTELKQAIAITDKMRNAVDSYSQTLHEMLADQSLGDESGA